MTLRIFVFPRTAYRLKAQRLTAYPADGKKGATWLAQCKGDWKVLRSTKNASISHASRLGLCEKVDSDR